MRDPKPESRSLKATRNPKAQRAPRPPPRLAGFRASGRFRIADFGLWISAAASALFWLTACSDSTPKSPATPAVSAQGLFALASTNFHLPSAVANGLEKARLLDQAAAAYQALLQQFPDDVYWAAQALRNLGNVRAAQGRTNEAVQLYTSVEQRYPQQRWEVLAALKSAADLLWDGGRRRETQVLYETIVAQFDRPEATQVERTIIRGAQARLRELGRSAER